jgi:hypothetical protein
MSMTRERTQEIKKLFVEQLKKTVVMIEEDIAQEELKDPLTVEEDGFDQRDILSVQVGTFLNQTTVFFKHQGLTQEDIMLGLRVSRT